MFQQTRERIVRWRRQNAANTVTELGPRLRSYEATLRHMDSNDPLYEPAVYEYQRLKRKRVALIDYLKETYTDV